MVLAEIYNLHFVYLVKQSILFENKERNEVIYRQGLTNVNFSCFLSISLRSMVLFFSCCLVLFIDSFVSSSSYLGKSQLVDQEKYSMPSNVGRILYLENDNYQRSGG